MRIAAASCVALAVLGGCAQKIGGSPTAPEAPASSAAPASTAVSEPSAPPASSTAPTTAAEIDLKTLPGTWRGEYECSQGLTGLELKIDAPKGDAVHAVFRFFPMPDAPKTPSGSFHLTGQNTEQGFVFKAGKWIKQPPGYSTVDLGVASVTGDKMTGRVAGPGCGDFSLTKTGGSK